MEGKYNYTAQKIDTCNNQIIGDFENMSTIHQMYASEKMPYRDKNRPKLTISETKDKFIFEDEKMPSNDNMYAKYKKIENKQKKSKFPIK